MNWAFIFIGVPLVCYLAQAVDYMWAKGRIGMCLTFVGYAIANVGLILDSQGV